MKGRKFFLSLILAVVLALAGGLFLTDKVFSEYQSRGINARTDLIISKELRDANTLTCNGDTFTSIDVLESWITLDMNKN